jgi:xanthine/uracil permease
MREPGLSCGSLVTACALFARPSRSLWQALAIAGVAGFGAAIGVHLVVGYTDPLHLGPAVAGSVLFVIGLALTTPGHSAPATDTATRPGRP